MRLAQRLLASTAARAAIAWSAALYIHLVFRTNRWDRRGFEAPQRLIAAGRPFIFCLWHGRLAMVVCARLRGGRYAALVSTHRDGRLIAAILGCFGIRIVGGSTFRGGRAALQGCVEALRIGENVGITPDGPRGPRMRATAGPIEIARRAGAPILPVSWSVTRRRVLRSWDRFLLPLPFGRGVFIVGEPLEVPATSEPQASEAARQELERRLNDITREADRATGHAPVEPDPSEDAPTGKVDPVPFAAPSCAQATDADSPLDAARRGGAAVAETCALAHSFSNLTPKGRGIVSAISISGPNRLRAARRIFEHVGEAVGAPFSIRLWDGSLVPLGPVVETHHAVAIGGPGVLGSLLRRPTLDNLIRQYAAGGIEIEGGDLFSFFELVRRRRARGRLRGLNKGLLFRLALPLLLAPSGRTEVRHAYRGGDTLRRPMRRDNRDFIRFHYDVSNEFYALFLDPDMQYSSAWFEDWGNSLEQAQREKLDRICRRLRLQPGETLLDIGCGWGGLLCHAGRYYGVRAHGVTLSAAQIEHARARIRSLGLEDRVTVELSDCMGHEGRYDKIACIEMLEHVGVPHIPAYVAKAHSMLRGGGIFVTQSSARRGKLRDRDLRRVRPEQRLLQRYIFPGGELDHVGHTIQLLEANRFDIVKLEGLRHHYAQTIRIWCRRLEERREEAVRLVGSERYRMWLAYLAAVGVSFADGTSRCYQIVARKTADRRT